MVNDFHQVVHHALRNLRNLQRKFGDLFHVVGQEQRRPARQRVRVLRRQIHIGRVHARALRLHVRPNCRPPVGLHVLQQLQVVRLDVRHVNVGNVREMPLHRVARRRPELSLVHVRNEFHHLAQVKIAQQRFVGATVRRGRPHVLILFKHEVRQLHVAVLVHQRNGLLAVVAHDAVHFGAGKPRPKRHDGGRHFRLLRQRGRRQHHVRHNVLRPVVLDHGVKLVVRVVHGDGGLVPVQ